MTPEERDARIAEIREELAADDVTDVARRVLLVELWVLGDHQEACAHLERALRDMRISLREANRALAVLITEDLLRPDNDDAGPAEGEA